MKTTVYVYPKLLSLCVCAPVSVDPGSVISKQMGDGFPAMFQALVRSGPRMMATPLLVLPLRNVFIVMPW